MKVTSTLKTYIRDKVQKQYESAYEASRKAEDVKRKAFNDFVNAVDKKVVELVASEIVKKFGPDSINKDRKKDYSVLRNFDVSGLMANEPYSSPDAKFDPNEVTQKIILKLEYAEGNIIDELDEIIEDVLTGLDK